MKYCRTITMAAALLAVASSADEKKPSRVGFHGMEIFTFKDGTRQLKLEDLNGDGRADIVFVNGLASRLEVLLRKERKRNVEEMLPDLDEVFDSEGVILDQQVFDLAIADLDTTAPGKHIVTFGRSLGLQLFAVSPEGKIAAAEDLFIDSPERIRFISVGDMDADGEKDIVVFREDGATVLWNDVQGRAFARRSRVDVASAQCYYGETTDVNGDGCGDLVFFIKPPATPMAVCLGDGQGGFGLEQPVDYHSGMTFRPLGGDADEPARLAVVLERGIGVRVYDYVIAEAGKLLAEDEVMPSRVSIRGSGKSVPAYAIRDVDSDGYEDLLVAEPELSRLIWYRGCDSGFVLPGHVVDSYADVSSMSFLQGGDLLVLSRKEKIAALHKSSDLKTFPKVIDVKGEVLAGTTLGDQVLLVTRNDDGDSYHLVLMDAADGAGNISRIEMPDLLNDPGDLLALDLGDAGIALLLFVPYGEPQMFALKDGQLTEMDASTFRGLSQDVKRAQVSVRVVDGVPQITVCAEQIARTYGWNGKVFDVVKQLNPADKEANLVASCQFRDDKGLEGTLLLDRGGPSLLWFPGDAVEPTKVHLKTDVSDIGSIVPLKAGDKLNLALLGRSSVNVFADGMPVVELTSCADYVSPSDEARLSKVYELELGLPRLTMGFVDAENNTLEIAERANGGVANLLTFKVYESSAFVSDSRGSHEPHGLAGGDVDGDGVADLVALVHDRLMIYFGE